MARGRGRGRGGSVANFLRVHTGGQARRVAGKEAGLEFNPEIRNLRGQVKGSQVRQGQLRQWYGQLAGDYAKGQQQGNEAFKTAQDAVAKQLGEASDRNKAETSELAGSDAAFAKLVGGETDAQGLSQIAKASAAAERSRVALNAPTAQEQANFLASLSGRRTAARMQGIEARRGEQARRDKIVSDLTAARKQRGAATVANVEKIREADRGYSMQQREFAQKKREAAIQAQQAQAQLALDQANLAREVREGKISAGQAQERIEIERKNARTSARSQRATARHYRTEAKGGGLTANERLGRKEHAGDAMSALQTTINAMGVPKNSKQWAKREAAVIEELGGSYAQEVRRAASALRRATAGGAYSHRARRGRVAGPAVPAR